VLADYLFVSEKSGLVNLKKEGIDKNKIHYVGNIMIDSLMQYLPKIEDSKIFDKLTSFGYVLVTFHRPANVDFQGNLKSIVKLLNRLSEEKTVIFPIHPRTQANLQKFDLLKLFSHNVKLIDPVGYIDFLALTKSSELVITDSGGIQEETTFLGIQCITVRDNTERPVTVESGTNQLIGTNLAKVEEAALKVLKGEIKSGKIPELWDGKTAVRIADIVMRD